MIKIKNKSECCGCTACFNICPQKAIKMEADSEGFLYPVINQEKCIGCGLCEKICPVMHRHTRKEETEGYIIRNKSAEVVRESTSGGAFTVVAEYILTNNGVVYGAGYDESMQVVCKKATCAEELQEMRGSKFVQSKLGEIFCQIKEELEKEQLVLFTGTPCQIAGLLSYLRCKPDNLICVDFVCRGVPSPELWKQYVVYMEKKYNSKMIGARFKNKTYGYHATTMKVDFANGKTYYGSGRVDPYMKAFVSEMSSRPSCSVCAFKGIERPSDITIFDCYRFSKITGKADDDKGYTSVLVHSSKGRKIFEELKPYIYWCKEDVEKLVTENGIMVCNSAKPNPKREEFYSAVAAMEIDEAMQSVSSITLKDKIIESTKGILFKLGLIHFVRKIRVEKKIRIN